MVVIRKVDRRPLWDRTAHIAEPWLRTEDLAADALQDLRTKGNRLSVYLISSLEPSELDRLLAAMAANRNLLDKLDYAAFDASLLNDLQIKVEPTLGETPDEEVNKWHRDLVELTACKLTNLGLAIRRHATVGRKYPKDIEELIRQGLRLNQIDHARLDQNLAKKILSS